MLQTAPQLFAGVPNEGTEICFYCGGRCYQDHLATDYVKSSFTQLASVNRTRYVCHGCVKAMTEGVTLTLIDGVVKYNQKPRGYSWVLTATRKLACTKAHRSILLDLCTDPPAAPFCICLSDSGQKHLLYAATVNSTRDPITVTLEGFEITYRPCELVRRMNLTKQVCTVTGKPAMADELSTINQIALFDHYGDDSVLRAWNKCWREPLSRLAAWLCPPKEDCAREFSN